jgi:magnesium-transporting ATPase (P-type)
MNLHSAFDSFGLATEIALIGLLVWRRVWHKLPVFFAYSLWAFLSDGSAVAMKHIYKDGYSIEFYFVITIVDFVFQFGVLVELAWSVLLPLRKNLTRKALWVVAAAILAVGAAIWPFAGFGGIAAPSETWRLVNQLQLTVSVLRALFFLFLAGCSQLLSIGWRDRELQVATGFGFYSLVSLAVATVNTHQATALELKELYWVVAISFLCSIYYWIFSFAQAETERRGFTPQMQTILLALAATARVACASLANGAVMEPHESES